MLCPSYGAARSRRRAHPRRRADAARRPQASAPTHRRSVGSAMTSSRSALLPFAEHGDTIDADRCVFDEAARPTDRDVFHACRSADADVNARGTLPGVAVSTIDFTQKM